ncbi:FMN-dependent NADH-azoreductase [Abditibacterium utsteinense]|uniref:FMN dependent NADH:quinone oxidoreductase n=1 Tax=Abditibacterium utsteinense TaxID=1960156 RepID=A0A2S8SSJ2_9BACT|nr:NAD(P)H-dependent oxidoreductase [Abditibacterium utsteinense]PQV63757.1 FMN-dependent NADH-azoreductase [Abditibacterium utsteinense]
MTQILHIDSSPRGERSHSRQLTRALVAQLQLAHSDATVVYHDLGHNPVPPVDEPWIAAAYSDPATHTPELKQAIALSNQLVDELLASDIVVVGAPMHNFSIPSTLKAYIDQIVRIGRTFTPQYEGLATGKKAFILCARGGSGYGSGEQMESANFQDPYFKTIFGLIGITDITFLHDEKTSGNESDLENSLQKARQIAQGV